MKLTTFVTVFGIIFFVIQAQGSSPRDRYIQIAKQYIHEILEGDEVIHNLAMELVGFDREGNYFEFEAKRSAVATAMTRLMYELKDVNRMYAVLDGGNPNLQLDDAYQYIVYYIQLFVYEQPTLLTSDFQLLVRQVTRPNVEDRGKVRAALARITPVVGKSSVTATKIAENTNQVQRLCANLRKDIYKLATYSILRPILKKRADLGIQIMMSNHSYMKTEPELQMLRDLLTVGIPDEGSFVKKLSSILDTAQGGLDPALQFARQALLKQAVKADPAISQEIGRSLESVIDKIRIEFPDADPPVDESGEPILWIDEDPRPPITVEELLELPLQEPDNKQPNHKDTNLGNSISGFPLCTKEPV